MYTYLPDLLAIQLASFKYFVESEISKEITYAFRELRVPIHPYGTLRFDAAEYKLLHPTCTPYKASYTWQTYGVTLYVPARAHAERAYTVSGPGVEQDPTYRGILRDRYYPLAHLPLMTDDAHFVVNGIRRVVVNQMIRCPSIYYKVKLLKKNRRSYLVSFLSDRGVWIRIERDNDDKLWFRINNFPMIPLFVMLRALGITDTILAQTLTSTTSLQDSKYPKKGQNGENRNPQTRDEALLLLGNILALSRPRLEKMSSTVGPGQGAPRGRHFLSSKVFHTNNYSLSEGGRMRINRRFNLCSGVATLQPEDVLVGLQGLLDIEANPLLADDIDHLENRRVRTISDLLRNQLRRGFKRLTEERGIEVRDGRGLKHKVGPEETEDDEHAIDIPALPHPAEIMPSNLGAFSPWYPAYIRKGKTEHVRPGHVAEVSAAPPVISMENTDQVVADGMYGAAATGAMGTLCTHDHVCTAEEPTEPRPTRLRVHTRYATKTLIEFFGLGQLSHYLDEINPLASLTQKRRLTSLGPGGVSRQSGLDMRDIHPSQYGRVCPIETPEGKNAGLVTSIASHAIMSPEGLLQGQYMCFSREERRKCLVFMSAYQQTQPVFYPFHTGSESGTDTVQSINGQVVYNDDARFVSISNTAMISVATCLIPFVEHDDGNRALMASNMQRQAVPLVAPERPIVGTGFEQHVARDARATLVAPMCGWVEYADASTVYMRTTSTLQMLVHDSSRAIRGQQVGTPVHWQDVHDVELQQVFHLRPFSRSNHNTLIYQRPAVEAGQLLTKGELLAESSTTDRGELSLGKNCLVAYMPWEGYNFEDAVVVNQRVVTDQTFTSMHVERLETTTRRIDDMEEFMYVPNTSLEDETYGEQARVCFDQYGIVRPGCHVVDGDILVAKRRPIRDRATPAERLLYDIFEMDRPRYDDCSLRLGHGTHGRVFDTVFFPFTEAYVNVGRPSIYGDGTSVLNRGTTNVYLLIKRPIQIGDKIAGRHGNKGIISNILPQCDMPYLPDGDELDILLNPLGVPSRMNVGQLFECLLGAAGMRLDRTYRVRAFDEVYGPRASQVLVHSQVRDAKESSWWFQSTQHPRSFGKARVFDGRTGQLFESPITVGVAYILKLVHLVDDKIHARSTGPYALLTQQPLKGRANQGGQRVGEMEVWALQGWSAAYILQEMLTLKSDDQRGRTVTYGALVNNDIRFPNPGVPESFRLLTAELRGLCFSMTYETGSAFGLPVFRVPRRPPSTYFRPPDIPR